VLISSRKSGAEQRSGQLQLFGKRLAKNCKPERFKDREKQLSLEK
jgi:hypothetical protein